MKVNKARPKDSSALAAIKVLTLYNPLGCLVLFFPVWPALIAASLWYKFYQKQRVILQSKTCDSCKAVALQLLPNELATPLLSASEQMEHKLGSAIHRIYQCTSCGWLLRYKSITISEYRMCNQCHTIASKRISPWKTIKEPTYSDAGLEVADYLCLMCGDKKQTTQKIPRKTPPIVTVLVIVTVVVAEAVVEVVAAVLVVDIAVAVERQVVFKINYPSEEVD